MHEWAIKFLDRFRRSADEVRLLRDPEASRLKNLVFTLVLAPAVLGLGLMLWHETSRWQKLKVVVPVEDVEWKGLAASAGECEGKNPCPANPAQPSLWNSGLDRSTRAFRDFVTSRKTEPFWVGARISRDSLARARAGGADVLFLGRNFARYTLWINGEQTAVANEVLDDSLYLHLREKEWQSPDGLYVAFRYENTGGYRFPELGSFYLGKVGFLPHREIGALDSLVAFGAWVRPFSFGLVNLLIALAFFVLWRSETLKQEYLWFAGFCFVHALTQLLSITPVVVSIGKLDAPIKILLITLEAGFPLVLGFSFARYSEKWILRLVLAFAAVGAISAFTWASSPSNRLFYMRLMSMQVAAYSSALGACVCLAEVFSGRLPARRRSRLLMFSGAVSVIAVLYGVFGRAADSGSVIAVWHRFAHLGAILVLSGVVVSDYREMALRMRRTPLTRYHSDERLLGKPVAGTIIVFDLKKSELLTSFRENGRQPGEVLSEAINPFRMVLHRHHAIEIADQGDGVIAFFPDEVQGSEKVIVVAVRDLVEVKDVATEMLRASGSAPAGWCANIRVAVTWGHLIPVIRKIGSDERYEWNEGDSQPLTEVARLLDIEKEQVDPSKLETTVLSSVTLTGRLADEMDPDRLSAVLGSKRRCSGKHGKMWEFHVQQGSSAQACATDLPASVV